MIPDAIRSYLDTRHVPYKISPHPWAATAQRTAELTHVSGKQFAKAVVLRRGGDFFMAIVPANERIDVSAMSDLVGDGCELANEDDFQRLFPDCEPGAMPPLGGLYGMPVIADECLAAQDEIAVNGGTHTDVIEFRWDDYVKAEQPRVVHH